MDPFTHGLSGAILARSFPKSPIPHRYVWLLAAVAMLPDIDYLLKFISDTTYLRHHRGITDSFLMLPIWSWLIYSLLPLQREQQPCMPWLIGAALLAHIFLDLITSFGTMTVAPFSDMRASLDLLFIIDPIFSALLLLPLAMMLLFKSHVRLLGISSLLLTGIYLTTTLIFHEKAVALTRQQHPEAVHVNALPQPFSPFRWMLVASYPLKESRTVIDFFPEFSGSAVLFQDTLVNQFAYNQTASGIQWQELPAMGGVDNISHLPGIAFYRWFARFPVLISHSEEALEFADLRFETMNMERKSFRLRIDLGGAPRAWLLWREDKKIELTDAVAPSTSW
ncbi:MAG: metal-dependent hydrolase [Mariprofundaceae bacterium]|nr:metal-dependent hydrolase [Mariprofundaceae bacterium]